MRCERIGLSVIAIRLGGGEVTVGQVRVCACEYRVVGERSILITRANGKR